MFKLTTDKFSLAFRIGITAFFVLFIYIFVYQFYQYAGQATDENWFRDVPSHLYIVEPFEAEPILKRTFREKHIPEANRKIETGDLLFAINGERVKNVDDFSKTLETIPTSADIVVTVIKPALDRRADFYTRFGALKTANLREIGNAVYVFDVFAGGASDRAGMKQGDLILSINGSTFEHMFEADAIMRQTRFGTTAEYKILRQNELITLHVTLARYDVNISYVIFSICALVLMGTGLFFGLMRPHLKAARLLSYAMIGFGFFLAMIFIRSGTAKLSNQGLFDFLFITAGSIGVAAWMHSSLYFPASFEAFRGRWLFLKIIYGFAVLVGLIVIFFTPEPVVSILIPLQSIVGGIWLVSNRKRASTEYKRINKTINYFSASTFILFFLILFVLFRIGSPQLFGYAGLPIVLMPFAYLYAIGRYRLLEMELRIKKNIQYFSISTMWLLINMYLFVLLLTQIAQFPFEMPNIHLTSTFLEITDAPANGENEEFFRVLFLMLIAVVFTLALKQFRQFGQKLIDKQYFRGKYNYHSTSQALANVLSRQLSLTELARGVAAMLVNHMQIKKAAVVFFRDEHFCCCIEGIGFNDRQWTSLGDIANTDLSRFIQKSKGDLRFSINTLPTETRDYFLDIGIYHVLPIRSQGYLLGVLLVGEKRSESAFHHEDLDYLSTVSQQAAVAIENAFLHEQLTEQERIKHELEIARRIQLSSLPEKAPDLAGLDISGVSIPAQEVGGDYYDYLHGDANHLTVVVGDVSGKGTSAALYMSRLQGILRSLNAFNLRPRELFIRANTLLKQNLEKQFFITAIGGRFNTKDQTVRIARAGHLPLMYFSSKTNAASMITPMGIGIGLDENGIFENQLKETRLKYEPGDIFLFVTDGITEAVDASAQEFGESRLLDLLMEHHQKSAAEIKSQIENVAKTYTAHDDLTIVVVKAE